MPTAEQRLFSNGEGLSINHQASSRPIAEIKNYKFYFLTCFPLPYRQ
ncbi:unnamed protein product [Spodoptera exigua]|nr:unnamed protein product [Spodoptera exigua]